MIGVTHQNTGAVTSQRVETLRREMDAIVRQFSQIIQGPLKQSAVAESCSLREEWQALADEVRALLSVGWGR